MGCAIEAYRIAVGNFMFILCKILSRKAEKARNRIRGLRADSVAAKLALITLLTLLCIGCVELNPGPVSNTNTAASATEKVMSSSSSAQTNGFEQLQSTLLSLTQAVNRIEASQSRLASTVDDRLQQLDDKISMKLENLDHKQDIFQNDIDALADRYDQLEKENDDLQNRISDLEENLDSAENRSRRNNLLFWGIPSKAQETWEECERLVQNVIRKDLGISENIFIERAHRVGSAIIVAFQSFKQKQLVLSQCRNLKGSDIYIREDFSARVRRKRQGLFSLQKTLRNDGVRAKMTFDKLVSDSGTYVFNLKDDTITKIQSRQGGPNRNSDNAAARSSPALTTEQGRDPQPRGETHQLPGSRISSRTPVRPSHNIGWKRQPQQSSCFKPVNVHSIAQPVDNTNPDNNGSTAAEMWA